MRSPRKAAYLCLTAVDDAGAYANLAMPDALRAEGLDGRDAAFATELAYGTIRMRGLYDRIIADAAGRPLSRIEPAVLRVLRLGAHQALGMRVPTHAAVAETVVLAREVVGERATGFANAVMRVIVATTQDEWMEKVAPLNRPGHLAARYSQPDWIVGAISEALKADGRFGELEQALAAANQPAKVMVVALPGLVDRDALVSDIPGAEASPFSPWGVMLSGGDPGAIGEVAAGLAGVQDEGSQLVVAALVGAKADSSSAPERWLDACAGPGGKAALLAAIAAQRGAILDAIELHPHRVDLVRGAVRAIPPGIVTVEPGDATEWAGGPYDRVLVDAPCTGLGALRRRPEARWRRSAADLPGLNDLQVRLLSAAFRLCAPGGVVAYSTCSPVVAETRGVVAAALASVDGAGMRSIDAREPIATLTGTSVEAWGRGPHVQLWTHVHGTDAMFVALFQKGSVGSAER